jgi:ribose transport system substrate-binding protein
MEYQQISCGESGLFDLRRFSTMNKNKRKGLLRALTACTLSAMMLITSGCGTSSKSGQKGRKIEKIAVITKQQLSFWDDVKKGADDAGKELGYEIMYTVAQGDNDYSTQIDAINEAVKQGAKGIVIAPNSKTDLNAALEEAKANGLVIININSRADFDGVTSLISASDAESGAVAARNAVKILRVTDPNLANVGKVAIIGHTADTAEARIEGFTSVLTSQIVKNMEFDGTLTPEEEMAGVRSDEKIAEQKKEATEKFQKGILQGNPCAKRDAARDEALKLLKDDGNGISVMFGTNTNTTLGICDAVSQLGLGSNIVVVGFNSDEDELNYIRTGVLDGTVVQNPYIMGYVGVRYVHKVIQHSTVPVELNTGSTFVTQANMNDDYVQLLLYPDKQ